MLTHQNYKDTKTIHRQQALFAKTPLLFSKTYRELATGPTHHMQTPAAENPAFLGLIKPTAKQEGRERNKAGGMRHGHSQRYGWLSSYRKETHSSKAFQDILPLC